jgi:putative ABC transport system ATP-binding protein
MATQRADLVVEAEGLSKVYRRGADEIHALRDVSLRLPRGTVLAITGPSGSGKTTLLNVLAGLDRPTGGEAVIDGVPLASLDANAATVFRRRHVGFVFQFFNLLPAMSAGDNVALPLLADRTPRREIAARVAAALAQVGMSHRVEHRPHELSGGEQQRVAIARALVMRPGLLLADEPTGNLDSATGAEILALMRRCVTEYRLSIVLVTHSREAAAAADLCLTMRDGRLAETRDRPSERRA